MINNLTITILIFRSQCIDQFYEWLASFFVLVDPIDDLSRVFDVCFDLYVGTEQTFSTLPIP